MKFHYTNIYTKFKGKKKKKEREREKLKEFTEEPVEVKPLIETKKKKKLNQRESDR